jgi:hypothetical protein
LFITVIELAGVLDVIPPPVIYLTVKVPLGAKPYSCV